MAVLGLRFCPRAFSSCGKREPLTIAASLVAEHRLQTRRLSSCGTQASCSAACGIFPDQGSNPCPLHWQADFQPLRHQGSPINSLMMTRILLDFLICGYISFKCTASRTKSSFLGF